MKNYLKGCIVLASIIMILTFFIIKTHQYLRNAQSVLMELKMASEGRKSSYELMERSLLSNSSMVQAINVFSDKWDKFLKKSTEHSKILNDVVEMSFSNTVAIAEKQSQHEIFREKGVLKDSSIFISLKVVGKFERIYSWLGTVEEAYPHVRINELELVAENMNAALTLRLQIPIMI